MSVASRSLSDTVLSRQERESSAAFSVAETGIENAMNALLEDPMNNSSITGNLSALDSFVTGSYKVTPSVYDLFVREGETAHLNTSGFAGILTISWTRKIDKTENIQTCTDGSGLAPAAIEITSIMSTGIVRSYYNSAGCESLSGVNGFTAGSLDGGEVYRSKISYQVLAGTEVVRIKPIYAGATIAVTGDGLRTQLHLINSVAVGGDAQKEIEVKRGLDAQGSIFDYAIFSAGSIIK